MENEVMRDVATESLILKISLGGCDRIEVDDSTRVHRGQRDDDFARIGYENATVVYYTGTTGVSTICMLGTDGLSHLQCSRYVRLRLRLLGVLCGRNMNRKVRGVDVPKYSVKGEF